MSKKHLALIVLVVLLAIIPAAVARDIEMTARTDATPQYESNLANITVKEIGNLTSLTYLKQDRAYCIRPTDQLTGGSAPFTANIEGKEIGTGTITYTWIENASATVAVYDIEAAFDTWDISTLTGLTGYRTVNLSYDVGAVNLIRPYYFSGLNTPPLESPSYNASAFFSIKVPGSLNYYAQTSKDATDAKVYNTLFYETPVSLSVHASETGNFSHKLEGVSIAFSNGLSGTTDANGTLSLDFAPKGVSYTFTATKTGYTTVSDYPLGDYGLYGGDLYFSMSTTTNGTWVRTYVSAVDANTGNPIYGSNIDIRNTTSNIWQNSTADADGVSSILTEFPSTIDMYVSATGYISGSRTGQPAFDGMYEVPMWFNATLPDPGEGNVNLIVYVHDSVLKEVIPGAGVNIILPSGATLVGTTSDAGGALFQVPNLSQLGIAAYKSGYKNANTVFTTTAWGPDTTTIEITKLTVTQTPSPSTTDSEGRPLYDSDGNPITYDEDGVAHYVEDTRTDAEKDADMMDQLRDAGPNIISLCILAIIFGLLRMIFRF